jgi:hypothetical protein
MLAAKTGRPHVVRRVRDLGTAAGDIACPAGLLLMLWFPDAGCAVILLLLCFVLLPVLLPVQLRGWLAGMLLMVND